MGKNKIPGIFRKQYAIEDFDSKILKKIHAPKDLEVLKNMFTENSDGEMELMQDIPDEIFLLLKPLAKSIKKNSGMVSRWKLSIIIVIAAGAIIFNVIFKDKLLEDGIESGLRTVFQADVEVNGLHFSFLRGSVSYESLIISSSENNLLNLLETGYSEFKISIKDLTKKRVRIEEMSLTNLRWNTPRSGSSSIDDSSSNLDKDETKDAAEGAFEVLTIKGDDYNSIIEQQKNNLKSIDIIKNGNEETKAIVDKWELIYLEKDKEIQNLEKDAAALKLLSTKGVNSIEDGRVLSKDLTEMYAKISNTKNDLLSLQTEYQNDKDALISLQKEIDAAVKADYEYIEGLANLSSGNMNSLASDVVEQYIRNRWNTYYENALKALKVVEKFQDKKVEESVSESGLTRDSGRVIPFFAYDAPGFLVDHILLSGGDDILGEFTAEIRTLTNEPDKVHTPLTFLASWGNSKNSIALDGFLDMRSDTDLPFFMNIKSPGNSITVEEGLSFLNISRLDTQVSVSGVSEIEKNNEAVVTKLDISLTELNIKQNNEDSFIFKTLKETLDSTKSINLMAEVSVSRDGLSEILVSSDFDDILADSIGAYLEDITGSMGKELKSSLSGYLSPYMDKNESLDASVGNLELKSLDQITSVGDLEKKTNLLIKEQEAQVQKFSTAAEDKVSEESAKLLDQVTDKIKLPGF